MLRILRRPLAAAAVVALASLYVLGTRSAPAQSSKTQIRVGALLSITGAGSSLGNTSRAALEVGVMRLNHQLKNAHVTLEIVDTGQVPDRAMVGFETLADEGVKLIIGPQSSSEVAAIMDAANQRGVLVVSQGSTASSLGIPNDMIFRFVPTDHVEGRATVDLIKKDGKRMIVPLWRNDRGNQGLPDSVRAAASIEGITVTEGFRYEPTTVDFGAALGAVAQQVAQAGGGTAVYLAGFEEVSDVLAAAESVQGLDQATWYGADGSAQAKQLVDNAQTVAFAENTGSFPSPLVALPKGAESRHRTLLEEITRRAKAPVDAFGLASYDAVQVGVRALVAAGASASAAALRSAFTTAADGYDGITGKIELDQNGDRASAPYAFWSICFKTSPAWQRTGRWIPGADPNGPGRTNFTGCPKTKK
jgi:branched-chain amino acid transport system substrate-binding protein